MRAKSPKRRSARQIRTSRGVRPNMRRNEEVDVQPDAPKGIPHLKGTRKTLFGRRVIEISPTFYKSDDLRFEASKHSRVDGDYFTGWLVRDTSRGVSGGYSDPIATKREAIELLADWSARDATERAAERASRTRR